jgi:signal transduction histidine kinase
MKSLLPRTIQARLAISHLAVSLVSIILISVYAAGVLYTSVRTQVIDQYEDLGFAAASSLEKPFTEYIQGNGSEEAVNNAVAVLFANRPGVHYTLYLPDGKPVVDSSGTLPAPAAQSSDPGFWEALTNELGMGSDTHRDSQGTERIYTSFRIGENQQVSGIIRLDVPLSLALSSARRSLGLLVAAALVMALAMGAVGFFLARSLAEPIENITLAAESLARGEMGARVEAPTVPHEIDRLAQAFNMMANQIQAKVAELRGFVANASHELRTPLTSIKLRVEALRSGALDDPPVAERFLAEIESEVDRLSSMVNDLLDLSRIEAGFDSTKRAPVDLGSIISDVYETFSVRAERAGVTLVSEVEPDLPQVMGNEDQLRRMLYNLVENAIKYTAHDGRVELSLLAGDQEETLFLRVKDTGFGIPAAQLPHIFERFYRVEATRPRYGRSHGSGLGLSISKSIAEAHGGRIGVTSQVGVGSTFWIELPALKNK